MSCHVTTTTNKTKCNAIPNSFLSKNMEFPCLSLVTLLLIVVVVSSQTGGFEAKSNNIGLSYRKDEHLQISPINQKTPQGDGPILEIIDHVPIFLSDTFMAKKANFAIGKYPVWNGGVAVIQDVKKMDPFIIGVSKSNSSSDGASLRNRVKSLIYQSDPHDRKQSEMACRLSVEPLIDSRVQITRFIFDSFQQTHDENPLYIFADLVKIRGIVQFYRDNPLFGTKYCLVNANDLTIMKHWNEYDGLNEFNFGSRPLENAKKKVKTIQRKAVAVLRYRSKAAMCRLVCPDYPVKVFDMRRADALADSIGPADFNCDDWANPDSPLGPLADSFYFAVKTIEMFIDPEFGYLDLNKLVGKDGYLKVALHNDSDHGFRDGSIVHITKSQSGCIDGVAHQIAKVAIKRTSDLIYHDESGCLFEGLSYIIAEMSKNFVNGSNDFLFGSECAQPPRIAWKDLKKSSNYWEIFPEPDKRLCPSKKHCQQPSICSSIPLYIFYKMATAKGWSTVTAGRSWLLANQLLWRRETTIFEAGCAVAEIVDRANISNGDVETVVQAWQAVGLDIRPCVPVKISNASIDFEPIMVENCVTYKNLTGTKNKSIHFSIMAPFKAFFYSFSISGNDGDADLYVKLDSSPNETNFDYQSANKHSSNEWISGSIDFGGRMYYLMIYAHEAFTNLQFNFCFT